MRIEAAGDKPYRKINRLPFRARNCAPTQVDYLCCWRRSRAKSPDISGVFVWLRAGRQNRSTSSQNGKTKHMSAFHREKVLAVRHWTDTLFSFTATRNSGFRFLNDKSAWR